MKKGIKEGISRNKNLGGDKEKKMKTKNKVLALFEITIVLCSLFLVAIPAVAAEQNQEMQKASASANTIITASEDDYVLGIYGNANEDDTIDMGDVVYTKLAIFGKKPKTELCDAKYDGRINVLDVIQTKLIILGKEKELTIVDSAGEAVTVHKPVKRIVVFRPDHAEVVKVLNEADKIVGVTEGIKNEKVFFPELSKLPSVGIGYGTPDYEAILNLNPDVIISRGEPLKEKLPSVTAINLHLDHPRYFVERVRTLGYILDKKEEAEEFTNWHEGWTDKIKSRTEGLSEDKTPQAFLWIYFRPGVTYLSVPAGDRVHQMCVITGGKNIAKDLPTCRGRRAKIDPEWLIDQNPDFIFAVASKTSPSSMGYGTDDPSEMAAGREDILKRHELAKVTAVKNENVYMMDNYNLATGGAGCLIGIAYMAKWFHPDLFEDLDPEAIHQEYLTRFQRIDYDLDEHGVFAYPPIEIDGGLAGIPDRYKGQI